MQILVIPDAQVKKDVPINHLNALGHYIVDKKPDVIVNIGDFADMPSLSIYEKPGSKITEGQRYTDDIEASHQAMETLLKPLNDYNNTQRKHKKKLYTPRMVLTLGNHENRIDRAISGNPKNFEGIISTDDLKYAEYGWEVYPFLEIVEINGVHFSHYFVNPSSLKKSVVAGGIDTKLKNLGFSFVMGHQQILQYGILYRTNGTCIQGIVAGAFYQHPEHYMGVQGNVSHWRGAVMLNNVVNGNYDLETLSVNYLLQNWDK